MDDKTQKEIREFNKGYNDARNGKKFNDGSNALTAAITLGLDGGPRNGAKEYAEGYKAGREDKKR